MRRWVRCGATLVQVSRPLALGTRAFRVTCAKQELSAGISQPALFRTFTDQPYALQTYGNGGNVELKPSNGTDLLPLANDSTTTSLAPITLRPYQHLAIEACLTALSSGLKRIGVSSPTGSGKTTMFMSLIPRIPFPPSAHPRDSREKGRTLILVSSVELANQAELAAKRLLGYEWSVEVEQSKRVASGKADVTIATYQTLNNVERLSKFDPAAFKLIIVDEAHHAAALSYLRILHYFNDDVEMPSGLLPITCASHGIKVPIIGFSATFSRPDQLALRAVFEEIVFHREISAMLEDGWLAPAKSTTVLADLNLDAVELNQYGDFKTSSLAGKVNTPQVNELIVRTYLHKAGNRRSTLIFCVDLDHVANLTQIFRAAGIDARSISSLSKADVRRDTISAFGAGNFPVLINCEVLTEGTDIPEIDCIMLARPTKSRNLLAQMVGRGLRLSPETGKKDCHIVDIVDSVSRANGMLVSPTLWGLSHEERERNKGLSTDEHDEGDEKPVNICQEGDSSGDYKITFIDQDDPFRLSGSTRPILDRASKNAWVACGKQKYILEMLGNGYISIDPSTTATWAVTVRRSLPPDLMAATKTRSPYTRVQHVGYADDLERALQTADKYAERTLGRELSLRLSRYAPWRQKLASDKAVQLLLKLSKKITEVNNDGITIVRITGKSVPIERLTAGEVSSWLCAAKHGAKSLYASHERAEERRQAKLQAKEQKARLHEMRNLPLPNSY